MNGRVLGHLLSDGEIAQIEQTNNLPAVVSLIGTLRLYQGNCRKWQNASHAWDLQREALEQERDQWKHAADVWQRRYREIVMESIPRLLWRRLVVQVARLMGGK